LEVVRPSFLVSELLNLHFDWVLMQVDVENIFSNIFQGVIFGELCDVERPLVNIILFTMLFYGVHFSFYYQHG